MNIGEYLDILNLNLIVTRHHSQGNRWTASIEGADIKDGIFLRGTYGEGESCNAAIEDYLKQIRGKCMVINAASKTRREFIVPKETALN